MITKEILEQAIEDYTEAVEKVKDCEDEWEFMLWLSVRKMHYGLCFYFKHRHGVKDISELAPKGNSVDFHWWKTPEWGMTKSQSKITRRLTVRLNFLKEKLKELYPNTIQE